MASYRSCNLFQRLSVASSSRITLCPCGCENNLDDKHEAHGTSTFSLIGECDALEQDSAEANLRVKNMVISTNPSASKC